MGNSGNYTIQDARQDIERLQDRYEDLERQNVILADGLVLALAMLNQKQKEKSHVA